MTTTGLQNFDTTVRHTNKWLKALGRELRDDDRHTAYRVLRATLQALRDLLTPEQSAKLAAQLPMLVRGFYFEGWTPGKERRRIRHADEFLELIADYQGSKSPDTKVAARAVFKVLADRVSAGEIDDVKQLLPKEVRELWPSHVQAAVYLGDDPHVDALAKPVEKFMTHGVLYTAPDAPLRRVLGRMNEERIRHALVVEPAGPQADKIPVSTIAGMLSNRDVLRLLERETEPVSLDGRFVRDVMTRAPLVTIDPKASMGAAARVLREKRISALPVVEGGYLRGLITTEDLLEAGSLANTAVGAGS